MHTNGEYVETDPLALQLIKLAVNAGWKPRDCIEFAREAHNFVTSTVSEVVAHQTVAPAKDIAVDKVARLGKSMPASASALDRPEWGRDFEIRRRALQTLADRKLTLKEAAEILGVSLGTVVYTAHKLKVRFHGRRGPARETKAAAQNGCAASMQINGLAKPKLLAPLNKGVKRRCPTCNQIFQPTEDSHVLCDDCENRQYEA
jgi:hypothetical protein